MKASNLGVCFGAVFMRPERESVAATLDIKYQNIIIEISIENVEEVCARQHACVKIMCVCSCICMQYCWICPLHNRYSIALLTMAVPKPLEAIAVHQALLPERNSLT